MDIRKYHEYRGTLIKKYRSFFGKYVFVIEECGNKYKVFVGQRIYENMKEGSMLTIGAIDHQLINIRHGLCRNTDEKRKCN